MKIGLTSVFVDDQAKALKFYTEVLGFVTQMDFPVGEFRFITVSSPEGAEGVQLLLEPNAHPAARAYQAAIYADGISATSFFAADVQQEYARLSALGVVFTSAPESTPFGMQVVFDDTVGNWIQLNEG